jgi:hypothetical protein
MQINLTWRKEWTPLAIAGGSSFLVGSGIGFLIGHHRAKKKAEDDKPSDIHGIPFDQIVQHPYVSHRQETEARDEGGRPLKVVDEIVIKDRDEPTPEPSETIRHNVFHREDDDWNYDKEVENRDPARPYIIHQDEFYEDKEDDLRQAQLTYYAGDDVLCDSDETPIYNVNDVVGKDNLKFGHGSMDPNIVFIRNEKMEVEYEVFQHSGHYVVEVLGEEMGSELAKGDLKHSVQRFRQE